MGNVNDEQLLITVYPGYTKTGEPEGFESIEIRPGDIITIVGPTGSGKTAFINDIEVFAQRDTVTGRNVTVNGGVPPESFVRDPANKPIAMITQNTKCLADLTVDEFLDMHIIARNNKECNTCEKTIELANRFMGEKIRGEVRISALSGGQTRSLMIADAVIISQAPILLLDEIENAGIFKEEVVNHLKKLNKAVLFVTHDPYIALLSDRRIVMRNGEVTAVLEPGDSEKEFLMKVSQIDHTLSEIRERIRVGEVLGGVAFGS